jgi:hypothetical protein
MSIISERRIILRSEQIRSLALATVSNLPVDDEQPLEILIRPYKAKRRNEANALYWVRLAEIADQAWFGGRQFDPDTLHEYFKIQFLPDECAKGIDKWTFLPFTEMRVLRMSTTDLSTSEFAEYLTQVEAFGADLGVQFSADRKAA